MAESHVPMIREIYAAFARGDVPAVLSAMDPRIVWNEAENFPYADGNPYIGPQAVLEGVFARLAADWLSFAANVEQLLDAGEHVVATGRYVGTLKSTGRRIIAQFAHVWGIRNGKAASFQQYTDTAQVAAAMAER